MKKRIALVLALLLALTLTGCKSNDYKSAVNAMESGDYATAAQQLEALGDYQDSKQLLKQCRYALQWRISTQEITKARWKPSRRWGTISMQ